MEPLQPHDPRSVAGYRLLARLGAGGMGVVYLGSSPGSRLVAVKVMHERFGRDAHYRARFGREVAAARTVTGAFTAPLLDADPDAAAPWLAMGYLPGLSLRYAIARHGRLPAPALRLLAVALAEALADIHRAGLTHRDLKPSNIMLTASGPRVIDFGIARPDGATAITHTGSLVGTPGFMSPEQASGDLAGPPGDVFALGAVLAFAGTGREPFAGADRAATLARVRRAEADLGAIEDRALRRVIAHCLHRDPQRRPTAGQVLDGLGRPTTSVQGTRWLPAELAEAIDRHAAAPIPAPGPPASAPTGPGGGSPATAGADARWLAGATTEVSSVTTPAEPGLTRATRGPGRRGLLVTLAAGIATGGAAVPLVRAGVTGSDGSAAPPATRPLPRPRSTAPRLPVAVRRWRTKVLDGRASPRLYRVGPVVMAADGANQVGAVDPRTGRVLWRRASDQHMRGEAIATGADVVYLFDGRPPSSTEPQVLRAIHPASQTVRWTRRVPFHASGTAAHGSLVCVLVAGEVRALAAADGRRRWTTRSSGWSMAAGSGLVVVVDGVALAGIDAASGRTRWRHERVDSASYCLISDDLVFTRDAFGTVHALRAHDGSTAWRRPVDYRSSVRHAEDGRIYVGEVDGRVRALHARTGAQVWARRLGPTGRPLAESDTLCLAGGTLWAQGPQQTVYALDAADGRLVGSYPAWTAPESQSVNGSQAVAAAGCVLLSTPGGYVEAVEPPQ